MDTNTKQGLFNDVIPDKMNTALMLDTAWLLLEAGLFPGYRSDKATKDLARTFIGSFILAPGDPYRYYAAFCQRILLTRHYIDTHPGFSFDFTIISWLDPANARGFNGTKAWFDNLLDKRKKSPMHRIELKAFPEAMLELAEERTAEIFHYWNDWFIERRAFPESLLFRLIGVQLAFDLSSAQRRLPADCADLHAD